eukprot:g12253.t1
MSDAPKKGSALADLFKKKKKVAVKASNLNEGAGDTTAKKAPVGTTAGAAVLDEKNWKDEEAENAAKQAELLKTKSQSVGGGGEGAAAKEGVSPRRGGVVNLADVQAEQKEKGKTWSDKPKEASTTGGGKAKMGAYQAPSNMPGAVTAFKYPKLGESKPGTYVKKQEGVKTAKNAFAGLDVGDDSDAEEEKLSKPALVSKTKGAKQLQAAGPGAAGDNLVLDDAGAVVAKRVQEEKAKKKLEKEAEKARLKLERDEQSKMEALQKKAAEKAAKEAQEVCDFGKFSFGQFDVNECAIKYQGRTKIVAAN